MWNKELVHKMFPDGTLPNFGTTAEELEYSDFETVKTRETKMARNMLGEITEITWYPDGRVERTLLYDVYPFAAVNNTHVLSFYGGKMVQNWLQLPEYQKNNEIKEINNAGFNYTGL